MMMSENSSPLSLNDTVKINKLRKKLTILMLSSIIITFLLFIIVISCIFYKINHTDKNKACSTEILNIPAHSLLLSHNIKGDILELCLEDENQQKFFILYDYKKAKIIREIKLQQN